MSESRVSAGSKLTTRPSASFRNDTISCVEDWQRRRQLGEGGRKPEGGPPKFDVVKVRNNTGTNLRRGEVVELGPFLLSHTDLEQQHRWFSGLTPDMSNVGWGITAEPIPAATETEPGEIGEVLCVGTCIAFVNIVDEDHKYANRKDGETVLESSSSGPIKILHKPTGGTPPEERECVVQLVDESTPEPKIVTPINTLLAAYGGGIDDENYNPNLDYANVDFNSLAISTGNHVAVMSGSTATGRNRRVYPTNCYIWERDSSGILRNTEQTISCINVTGLPIMPATWCIARKVAGSDDWVATKIGEFANASKHFIITPSSLIVKGNEAKILRYPPTAQPEGTVYGAQDWAYAHGNDVFIHHPGTYTITFGAEVNRSNSWTADTSRYTDSDDSDYVDIPNPADVQIDCLLNWNPTVGGSLASSWPVGNRLIYMSLPAKGSACSSERTFTVNHTLDNWHGQPYLRLSLAMKVFGHGDDPEDTRVSFRHGWIHIRPEGGAFGGNEGTGYNVFLGTSGAFQWWGGGSAPVDFDEDGEEI